MPEHLAGRDKRRPIYLTGELFDWIDNAPDIHDAALGLGGRSRFEHLEQSLADFCCAPKRPSYGDIKLLMPNKDRVWSLHTRFFRLLGWVPAEHRFVGTHIVRIEEAHGATSRIDELKQAVIDFAAMHALTDTMKPGDFNALFPAQA